MCFLSPSVLLVFVPVFQEAKMRRLVITLALVLLPASLAHAEVPPDLATKLCEIGRVVDPPGTAKLYRSMHPNEPYAGVTVARSVSFGPDPDNVVDIFKPASGGGSSRPVLIYVSGGAGNRKEGPPPAGPVAEGGDAFYDNIMLWAVKNGMIGVNMERRAGGGGRGGAQAGAPPAAPAAAPAAPAGQPGALPAYVNVGASDVAAMVRFLRQNISKYNGNPSRMFIWAHSAGNGPVSGYIGHPELYGPDGVGLKGAILMSGASSMFPVAPAPAPAGQTLRCAAPAGGRGGAGGRGAGGPGGAPGGGGGGGRGGAAAPPDVATQLVNSNLLGFLKSDMSFFIGVGEIDTSSPAFGEMMKQQLCAVRNCPTTMVFKDHSHMSLVFSPNTSDNSVTGPILKWLKSVK
jgi:hypothetical protein